MLFRYPRKMDVCLSRSFYEGSGKHILLFFILCILVSCPYAFV